MQLDRKTPVIVGATAGCLFRANGPSSLSRILIKIRSAFKVNHHHNTSSLSVSKDAAVETVKYNERPPPVFSEVQKWFQASETKRDGKLSPKELQTAFEVFQNKHFSDGACKFIVRLFDLDHRGGLDIKEFEQLYYYVKQWVNAFHTYDYQRTGFLDEEEFANALKHMDINFSPDFVKFLMKRGDPTKGKIALDQFIVTCIQIQKYTEEFKQRDENYTGEIQLKYEDFLEMILKCM